MATDTKRWANILRLYLLSNTLQAECGKTIELTPKTVGQYTGLVDKNGKRIFEGDIVRRFWLGEERTYCIEYEKESACYIGNALNKSGFTTFDHDGEMFEIIGNIHDNPELLEVNHDER